MQCLSGNGCDGLGAALSATLIFKPDRGMNAQKQPAIPLPKRSRLSAIGAHSVKPPREIHAPADAISRHVQKCSHG